MTGYGTVITMNHANFVHLHAHSAYSLSEGAIKIPQIIGLCEKEAMPAVAVTDTGNLFGALEFSLAARRAGVQPIIGCQIAVARPAGIGDSQGQRAQGQQPDYDDLVLLVRDRTGYQNLLKLVSRSFLETPSGERPHITFDDLENYAAGLIALTGGPSGAVGALLAAGQVDAATDILQRLMALFPGALYVELMRDELAFQQIKEFGMRGRILAVGLVERHPESPSHHERPDSIHAVACEEVVLAGKEEASSEKIQTISERNRLYAQEILAQAGGNKSKAAGLLGVDRKTLYRLLKDKK